MEDDKKQEVINYRKNIINWEKILYYNYKKVLFKKMKNIFKLNVKMLFQTIKFTSKSWSKQKKRKITRMNKKTINLLQKADLKEKSERLQSKRITSKSIKIKNYIFRWDWCLMILIYVHSGVWRY